MPDAEPKLSIPDARSNSEVLDQITHALEHERKILLESTLNPKQLDDVQTNYASILDSINTYKQAISDPKLPQMKLQEKIDEEMGLFRRIISLNGEPIQPTPEHFEGMQHHDWSELAGITGWRQVVTHIVSNTLSSYNLRASRFK